MSGCACSQEEVAARKRQGKRPSKSPVNLGPSARNTCSSLHIQQLFEQQGYYHIQISLTSFYSLFLISQNILLYKALSFISKKEMQSSLSQLHFSLYMLNSHKCCALLTE